MTARLPAITGRRLLAAPAQLGFTVVRVRGSHHFIRHPDGRGTAVPVHSGETIGPGLLSKILRDCDVTKEDLRDLI